MNFVQSKMDKRLIKQILLEQREEIKKIFQGKIIEREKGEELKTWLKDDLIKVITGVRRCGKSVLAHQVLKEKDYGYVNFDDERLIGVKTQDLNSFLEVLKEINPYFNHLLLDEIQNVPGWELFVNRLKRNGYNLVITGSNSKLLSRELSSHLTGRHIAFELYPFSFIEFLDYKNFIFSKNDLYLTEKRAIIKRLFDEYLNLGGLPESYKLQAKSQYLRDLYDKIITRDVVSRYKIKYIKDLKEISLYLVSNFAAKITYHKLKNIFEMGSVHTVKNYLDYLEEAYLIFQLDLFSFKPKKRIRHGKKIFSIDSALINSVSAQFSSNLGRMMENLVFLQLRRKGKNIYFYDDYIYEVDFVVKDGLAVKQLIQVCFDLSNFETKKREIRALTKASQELGCKNLLIITWDEEKEEICEGKRVNFIPLWQWLLE